MHARTDVRMYASEFIGFFRSLKTSGNQKSEWVTFWTIFLPNLAKFQLYSMIFEEVDSILVIFRYRNFKPRDPFFGKNGLYMLNIFQNPLNMGNFVVSHGLVHGFP